MPPRNLVNLHSVSKGYGSRAVLHDVTLGISEGERVGVVGENGAGKSTLMRLLAGAEAPDTGTATRTTGLNAVLVSQRVDLTPGSHVYKRADQFLVNRVQGSDWICSAIDLNLTPGKDPSHPAFYLDGQEALAGNMRAFWVLDPCAPQGGGCASGDECCSGYCQNEDQ